MYKDLLPIGSIVALNGAKVKVMICGRVANQDGTDEIYEYIGCVYPIGITADDQMLFFNGDAIENVLFIGFQDEEELTYRHEILDQLGELKIVNGEIVKAEE